MVCPSVSDESCFGEDAETSPQVACAPERHCESGYRLLVRLVGVARGFGFAVLRTLIVPSRAIAGVGSASGYFFVEGQIRRQG